MSRAKIAADTAYALDPVLWAREILGFVPDEWQSDLLLSKHPRTILNMSRQVGKSTSCAVLALWTALYRPGSLILLVSPSLRQSQELFLTWMNFYRQVQEQPALHAESALRATLHNKSRVVALPGSPDTLRGYAAVSLIILDEASRIDESLVESLTPMMATKRKARLILLSSPAGKVGFFYRKWVEENDWHKVKVTADQCARISPDFLASELRELGPQKYATEYLGEFLSDDAAVFSVGMIDAAFSAEVEPLWK